VDKWITISRGRLSVKKQFGTPLEINVFLAVLAKGTACHRRKVNINHGTNSFKDIKP
jgi:hypothetical protein